MLISRTIQPHRTLLVLALGMALAACGKSSSGQAPAAGAMPPMPVTVQTVTAETVPVQTEVVAQTEGAKQIEVRPRVGGIILKRLYQEGEPVKAGQDMFLIDPVPFQLQVEQSKALIAQQKARIEQTAREAQRLKGLLETRSISQREYDNAASDNAVAAATLLQYQAQLREAELNLSYTHVKAPESGIGGRFVLSEGALASANTTLLSTIVQVSPIWVRFSLSESELLTLGGHLRPGRVQDVRLILADNTEYPQAGKINFSASQIDPALGTQQLRAEFQNADRALLPGQFVRVRLTTGKRDGVYLIPQTAILTGQQGKFVFVAEKDKEGKTIAAARPIAAGGWFNDRWVVLNGLTAGDQVITDNLIKVRPGAPVAPHAPDAAPPAADKTKG
ncbi:efflux RND transporter periplasmic adaptor subunit [Methylophilus medardicus]|uniref:Efflux RND transporter periplasmic adaptor subunit n=1 Tax=Methylophilus medardicus TaxID=2588534 RepID=A0A5B8CQN3_9PROT|nr:efflux RND transporter periplasmic adaptor subunit [Methylophilus medardicus]QDC43410.1 efflux RND transporter periplasmic adaptor subunit [Methylophilus medardicus]QDC48417.1 efflux RND transporter periplasmic adaptor subunit [Methylophilus medardicus]QDC52122.1 efflux RND transporter periplasmic adaptor subunit [Methylophilus medardicus]